MIILFIELNYTINVNDQICPWRLIYQNQFYGGGGLIQEGDLFLIRCLLICFKKNKQGTFYNINIFQRVIYEIILITQHVLINDQINP